MSAASEALCLSCGFCCDGTLFGLVPLKPAEVATSERLGLRVLNRPDGSSAFEQPCAALSGCRCEVYAERPGTCRAYRCDLLNALEETEVSLEEAQEIVARVRALGAQLAATLPEPTPELRGLRQRLRAAHAPEEGRWLPPETLADLTRWETLLTHHFRGRRG